MMLLYQEQLLYASIHIVDGGTRHAQNAINSSKPILILINCVVQSMASSTKFPFHGNTNSNNFLYLILLINFKHNYVQLLKYLINSFLKYHLKL